MSIEEHKFIDPFVKPMVTDGLLGLITQKNQTQQGTLVFVDRDDVIAMAKHFKLTEGDLK